MDYPRFCGMAHASGAILESTIRFAVVFADTSGVATLAARKGRRQPLASLSAMRRRWHRRKRACMG